MKYANGLLLILCAFGVSAAPAPVLEYLFDENPGFTVHDSSGNGLDASNVATADYSAPIWAGGHTNTGLQFDGSGDLLNLGDRDELDLQRYTIMAWVMYHSPPPPVFVPGNATRGVQRNYEIIEKIGAYWLNIRLDTGLVRSGGRFGGPEQDGCTDPLLGSKETVDSSTPVPESEWTHVATTYNGTKLKIYINGRLKGATEVSGAKCNSNFEAVIGAKYTAMPYKDWPTGFVNNNFNGTMDDFRIYDTALSGEDIRDVLASDPPPEPSDMPGGTVAGMLPESVSCRANKDSWVIVARDDAEWLCEAAGLIIVSGDTVKQKLAGIATETDITGNVSGMQPAKIRCVNRSTGIKRTRSLSTNAWSCLEAGVNVSPGDDIRVILTGAAD